jgi:hypothetical protein
MRNPQYWMIVGGLLLIGVPAVQAATVDSGRFSLAAGADYSSGKYGTDTTTDIWSVPVTAAYQSDRWTFKLTVPYINISGAGNVIPGVGRVNNGNPIGRGLGHLIGGSGGSGGSTATSSGSASGLGDITASAGYQLFASADRTAGLDLTGKVKFGTADEDKGLGTGKNDYGLALDTYKVSGAWTAFGGVGWMKYGSSQYIRLENGFNANFGADYKLDPSNNIGAYYYYRERITTTGAAQSEVAGYWNHKFNASLRVQAYALAGFTDGSPDYGVGASLKYSF